MKIVFIGDVVGKPGEEALNKFISKRSSEYDVLIVNGENIDKGFGITESIAKNLLKNGVDVITLGNHSFDKRDVYDFLNKEERIIRPYNFSITNPGKGYTIFSKNSKRIAVINLQGKVYMNNSIICPFYAIDNLLEELKDKADIFIVDFHAELTSEKMAMGWNLAGKVTAICGTHTHVQSADEKILFNHSAYITDVGMTGGHNGVIGMNRKESINRFKTGLPTKLFVCEEDVRLNGVEILVDDVTNKAIKINRINLGYGEI